jgi:hypothetical protein
MADDTPRVEAIEVELRQLRDRWEADRVENARLRAENVSLRGELAASRAQLTAAGEIPRVITTSQASLDPVFDAMADRAHRLCRASSARLYLVEDNHLTLVAAVARSDEDLGAFARSPNLRPTSRPCSTPSCSGPRGCARPISE